VRYLSLEESFAAPKTNKIGTERTNILLTQTGAKNFCRRFKRSTGSGRIGGRSFLQTST
jgi:hypothetical protein